VSFLGIAFPPDVCRRFREIPCPGKKVGDGTYHITMIYFGDKTPVADICKAIEVAAPVMQQTQPFELSAANISYFPENPDDKPGHPIVVKVDSPELHELRAKLAEAFDAAGVEYSKKFPDFKPHVTLAYSPEPHEKTLELPIKWTADETVLWAGDEYDDRFSVKFQLPPAGPTYEQLEQLELEIRGLLAD